MQDLKDDSEIASSEAEDSLSRQLRRWLSALKAITAHSSDPAWRVLVSNPDCRSHPGLLAGSKFKPELS